MPNPRSHGSEYSKGKSSGKTAKMSGVFKGTKTTAQKGSFKGSGKTKYSGVVA